MRTLQRLSLICLAALLLPALHTRAQNWNEIIKAVASDRAANDQFGISVAIDGEYAIVGASEEDEDASGGNTLSGAGSAYIFQLVGGVWTQQQKIVASDRAASDQFGISVAISGNYAIVGTVNETEDASGGNTMPLAGSAYIFELSGGVWTQQQKIVASDRAAGDQFGISVAISATHAIVGAFFEDEDASGGNTLSDAGSAYIFQLSGGVWTQQQKIVASDRAGNDQFGRSVAISGDHAIVGALGEDEDASGGNTLSFAGSAYIFELSGGTWTQQQKVVASDRAIDDYFGNSVAISGDRAIVGARGEDHDASGGNTLSSAGSAYIFQLSGGTWIQQQKIVASDRAANDFFGFSVAISGDRAIVGARGEDEDVSGGNTLSFAGSAYIFELSGGSWTQQQKIVASDRNAIDFFGGSVAISGDHALVGAYNQSVNTCGVNPLGAAGAAYFFGFDAVAPVYPGGTLPTWKGTISNNWNTAGNWSHNAVPTATDNVIISECATQDPRITNTPASPAVCANLGITSGVSLYIEPGAALTVNGDIGNEGNLIINADASNLGSLICCGAISGNGLFSMDQHLTGSGFATPDGLFYYVSSPVTDATAAAYSIVAGNKLWSADETTVSYPQITNGATALNPMQGYIARMGLDLNVSLSGSAFNTGDLTATGLTRTGTTSNNRGYNLMGNPYPSTIHWNDLDKTNLETSMWFRTHQGSTMLFDTYNQSSGIGTNNNGNGAITGEIPPTQAFWVRVDADGNTGQLGFNCADRTHQAWSSIYKVAAEEGNVRMTFSNGIVSDETIVLFHADALDGYDDFDSHKMWAAPSVPQLYTALGTDTLVINGMYSTTTNPVVDLGVKVPTAGNYSLSADQITIVGESVHLEDRLLNVFQDLNAQPIYNFTSVAGNIGDRFALHFGASVTDVNIAEENRVLVYSSDNRIQVVLDVDMEVKGAITVYDMAGRVVDTRAINAQRTALELNSSTGIYIVKVDTDTQTVTRKINIQ